MSNLYYNKTTDTAFRVRSKFGEDCWCVEVKPNNGRSKMYAREFPMNFGRIEEGMKTGQIFELHNPKLISRDINFIRAGIKPPANETKGGKAKPTFTMRVGSLIDENPSDYIGIYNKEGNLIGHEYNGKLSMKEQEAEELIEEVKNEKQLNLF